MIDYKSFDYLKQEYEENGRSTSSIAKENGTHANTIRRLLKKHGIPIRSKSQAQKNYLDNNPHQREGLERTEEEKLKISKGLENFWENAPEEHKAKIKESVAKASEERWNSLSEQEKKEALSKMNRANRFTRGSKNENMVGQMLSEQGYKVEMRTRDYLPRHELEIDIALPKKMIAIEWDGVTHFEAVHGDEKLQRRMERDERKNQLLTGAGWTVIRCRDHSTSHSMAFCRRTVSKINKIIDNHKKGKVYYIDAE